MKWADLPDDQKQMVDVMAERVVTKILRTALAILASVTVGTIVIDTQEGALLHGPSLHAVAVIAMIATLLIVNKLLNRGR